MKENILILSNNLNGLFSFRREVTQAIKDAGYEVYISIPDIEADVIPYYKENGYHIVPTIFDRRGVNPWEDLKLLIKYIKIIRALKPKAVLTYTIKPNVYGGMACRLLGYPLMANVTGLGDAVENGGWMQRLTLTLYKMGLSKSHRTFFQNATNRDFCINHGISGNNAVLLPGSGVNLKQFVYQEYPVSDVITILYMGRIMVDKGSNELFETATYIKGKYPKVEFQILGYVEGDFQTQLDNLTSKGIINFLGATSDIRPYLAKAHCTILPSYHEGMSNTNLESAANGRPVITTDVPGCRETVDDGKTGFLVKAKDAQSLIDGVERFLALTYEQKKQMGIKARKKVEREFDRQIVVKAYLKAINSIS